MTRHTLLELAQHCGAVVEGDGARVVVGPAALLDAGPDQISFFADPRYQSRLEETRAAGVLVGPEVERVREDLTFLRCDDPSGAFTQVALLFARPRRLPEPGVHPAATVDPSVRLGEGVRVGAGCVVGADARLGDRVVLHPGVIVGPEVEIGPDGELFPGVVLYQGVQLGARCILHGGTVIGSDGFGFEPTDAGWTKVPQTGSVVIGDDVETGANVAIDRGRFGPTRIGNGVKIDNLVHVGHNVEVGDHALLIAQVGVSGSTRIGRGALLAGQVGVGGHITVGDGARLAGGCKLYRDVPAGEDYMPILAFPKRVAMRAHGFLLRLPALQERLARLEARLAELEGSEEATP